MKVDCQWFSARLEDYFCDRLNADQARLAGEHLATCQKCNEEVQSLQAVDGVVRQLFDHRMSLARTARPVRRGLALPLGLSAAGVTAAGVLAFALWFKQEAPPLRMVINQPPPPAELSTNPSPDPEKKDTDTNEITRLAPKVMPRAPAPAAPDVPVLPGGPAFAVTDPAGFSRTLDDYRGYVLVFGVISADQPDAARNLERVYHAFGPNRKVQILGVVASRRENRIAGTSFPLVFNNGSQLLGARETQMVMIDASGRTRLRRSLIGDGDAIVEEIRGELDRLGIR